MPVRLELEAGHCSWRIERRQVADGVWRSVQLFAAEAGKAINTTAQLRLEEGAAAKQLKALHRAHDGLDLGTNRSSMRTLP